MPLPSGRGAPSSHPSLHGSSAKHGEANMAGPYSSYGRPHGSDAVLGNSAANHDSDNMYNSMRNVQAGQHPGAAGGHHLPTVTEEDIFNAVGGLELVAEQDPELAEYAAAAVRNNLERSPDSTRILIVRKVARDVSDTELQDIFQAFGDVQGLHTGHKHMGLVVVAYYDLRAAVSAQTTLQGTLISKIAIDVQFAPVLRNGNGRAVNQGQVVVFNLDPDTSNDQLVWLFSKFGDVQGIKQSPTRPNQKFISFYDVRHAAAAMRHMNRAEQLNKIPPHVTPQQIASLQTVTSGPNLMQLAQLQGMEASSAAAAQNGGGWDALGNPVATMEGLLHLVNQQNQQANMPDHQAAFNRLGLDAALGNMQPGSRGLPLSDSASSIASVPGSMLLGPGGQAGKGLPGHGSMGGAGAGGRMDQGYHNPGGGDPQAAAAAQQLLHASEAANMLMGLNLGGMDRPGAGMWPGGDSGQGMGLQDPSMVGLWPGAAGFMGAGQHLNQIAALQELQLRQQQMAAVQQVQALQAAGINMGGVNPLNAAANLQAAAQILQAAGLSQLGGAGGYLPNAYNAAAAAQILHQAGLGLPALGMHGGMGGHGGMPGAGQGGRPGGPGPNDPNAQGHRCGGRLSRRTTDPAADAERKAQQEKLYALDLDKIARGDDKRTTLMIKNIPNKYTQKMLLATIDDEFKGTYDFFYLPIDFKNKCNVGYAFINMVQPVQIIPLVKRFNNKKWERFNSEKVCNISYARIQGRAALVQHFQNSSLMHEDKRCRPILFTLDDAGDLAGEQEPFPAPSSGPGSVAGGASSLGHGSGGSGTKLSGLAGSTNSLRSREGSTNSLRDMTHKHPLHA